MLSLTPALLSDGSKYLRTTKPALQGNQHFHRMIGSSRQANLQRSSLLGKYIQDHAPFTYGIVTFWAFAPALSDNARKLLESTTTKPGQELCSGDVVILLPHVLPPSLLLITLAAV